MWNEYLEAIKAGEIKALARAISLVENEVEGYEQLLKALPNSDKKIIGITGPPGAGKSTLVDSLIGEMVNRGESVAVLCVDPSSPFNLGAVLGDRIRMNEWYNHPKVFIRSLASRGSLGGLHPRIIEIADVIKAAAFDHIIIETVGVGQSEIEITGLADTTVVVLVPEAGDEIQTMKAGLMEIADVFAVNKADRPGADMFIKNLRLMLAPSFNKEQEIKIISTVALHKQGVDELYSAIRKHQEINTVNKRRFYLLAEKAYYLIQQKRMKNVQKHLLAAAIEEQYSGSFNIYRFADTY